MEKNLSIFLNAHILHVRFHPGKVLLNNFHFNPVLLDMRICIHRLKFNRTYLNRISDTPLEVIFNFKILQTASFCWVLASSLVINVGTMKVKQSIRWLMNGDAYSIYTLFM